MFNCLPWSLQNIRIKFIRIKKTRIKIFGKFNIEILFLHHFNPTLFKNNFTCHPISFCFFVIGKDRFLHLFSFFVDHPL
jgi:hypothetical protein